MMESAENILAGNFSKAKFTNEFANDKFQRNSELPGKLIREGDSYPSRWVKNEVRAMNNLISTLEGRYGIATVQPQYLVGPGDKQGEARAVIVRDEIQGGEDANEMLKRGANLESLDMLNQKFIDHTMDLYREGGLFNPELLRFDQYLYVDDEPILVDVEPHFTQAMAPQEARIYGDVELVPIFEMLHEATSNAIQLSKHNGHQTPSYRALVEAIGALPHYTGTLGDAKRALLTALIRLDAEEADNYFNDDDDIFEATFGEWESFSHQAGARTYVSEL